MKKSTWIIIIVVAIILIALAWYFLKTPKTTSSTKPGGVISGIKNVISGGGSTSQNPPAPSSTGTSSNYNTDATTYASGDKVFSNDSRSVSFETTAGSPSTIIGTANSGAYLGTFFGLTPDSLYMQLQNGSNVVYVSTDYNTYVNNSASSSSDTSGGFFNWLSGVTS